MTVCRTVLAAALESTDNAEDGGKLRVLARPCSGVPVWLLTAVLKRREPQGQVKYGRSGRHQTRRTPQAPRKMAGRRAPIRQFGFAALTASARIGDRTEDENAQEGRSRGPPLETRYIRVNKMPPGERKRFP